MPLVWDHPLISKVVKWKKSVCVLCVCCVCVSVCVCVGGMETGISQASYPNQRRSKIVTEMAWGRPRRWKVEECFTKWCDITQPIKMMLIEIMQQHKRCLWHVNWKSWLPIILTHTHTHTHTHIFNSAKGTFKKTDCRMTAQDSEGCYGIITTCIFISLSFFRCWWSFIIFVI